MQNSQQKGTVKMAEKIASINQVVNGFIWGVPAMICIIGVGLLLSVRTRFIQIRKFGVAMKNTVGKIFDKTQAKDGSMSPFQAVCTALAGTVGTGNIAGVVRLPLVDRVQSSGCGAPHSLACVRNSQKSHWQSISARRTPMESM